MKQFVSKVFCWSASSEEILKVWNISSACPWGYFNIYATSKITQDRQRKDACDSLLFENTLWVTISTMSLLFPFPFQGVKLILALQAARAVFQLLKSICLLLEVKDLLFLASKQIFLYISNAASTKMDCYARSCTTCIQYHYYEF